jgi:hypothetical protein
MARTIKKADEVSAKVIQPKRKPGRPKKYPDGLSSITAQPGTKEFFEIRKLELEVLKRETEMRREDRRWMLKADAWAAIGAVFSTLLDSLKHHFHEGQSYLVTTADGDQARSPEVYEAATELIARACNELAGMKIEGIFAVDRTAIEDETTTEEWD